MAEEKTRKQSLNFTRMNMIATSRNAYDRWREKYETYYSRPYTPEEVRRIIESGSLREQQRLSKIYFYKYGYYGQILTYYATLLKYTGILIPHPSFNQSLSEPYIKKKYIQVLDYIDKMQLPTFLTNCSLEVLVNGSYYGLILEVDKNKFNVLDLPSEYCCSRFKDYQGNDIVEFDVSYFNTISDESLRKDALSLYPKSVRLAWERYKKGKLEDRWVIVPEGICFTFLTNGRPPFLSLIPAVLDYEDAIKNNKEKDAEEIKKIIVQQIPHLPDGRLLFEPDEAEEIHGAAVGMMSDNPNVSVLTTYADVDAISSQTSTDAAKNTTLAQMLRNIYSTSGTSSELFASTSSSTLPLSLKKDLAFMMYLGNKYSTFITNIVNLLYSNTNLSFKYTILPISYFNVDEYVNSSFKLASSGYSFLLPALGLGISQKDLVDIKDLENDLLKLQDYLIPLQSSYTQTTTGTVGRPRKAQEEKAEQTIANENSQDNVARTGSE